MCQVTPTFQKYLILMCERPRKQLVISSIYSPELNPGTVYMERGILWCMDNHGRVEKAPYVPKSCINMEEGEVRYSYSINVPCGKCVECLTSKATEWSYRIVLESQWHTENCFLTLTYQYSPVQLVKRDFQLFMKKLRKYLAKQNITIRYFMCGEYGSQGKRPHFHCIIFGWRPKDLEILSIKGTEILYKSSLISKIWGQGFVSVGDVSSWSAKYCAKYLQKLNSVPKDWVQPYVCMSNRPGIGFKSIDEEQIAATDKIYVDGKYKSTPRYFYKVLYREGKYDLIERLKADRLRIAGEFGSNIQKSSNSLLTRD